MNLRTTITNVQATYRVVKDDVRDAVRARRQPWLPELDDAQAKAVADLRRDGFAVVPNYWTPERALAMRDQLEAYLADGKSRDFDEGAWLRFWDDRAYDQGVRRIYHAERLVPELSPLRNDPFVLDIAAAYYGQPFHSNVLVFQHNVQSNEHTRYYHVDSFVREFKSFIYLDDVDDGNGPFAYLSGTQKNHRARLKKQVIGNGPGESDTSFRPEEVKASLNNEVRVVGSAGTLILADVRGIHRGTPQVDRSRSVLVNYILKHPGDLVIDK